MKHFAADTLLTDAETVVSLPTRPVLGLPLVDATTEETADRLLAGTARRVYFLNAHCANLRAKNANYAAALERADAILPDGIGVELAAKMDGIALTENLNGTDFVPALLARAAVQGKSVFLFGGTPGTAEAAARTLCHKIPGLRIAGTLNGYEDAQCPHEAVARINASGADILLVAMGVPMQELWIDRYADALAPRLVFGVGALLDFLAGNVRRAPAAVRKARMEWVWRLAMEPRRMANRYLVGNFAFLARAALYSLRHTHGAEIAKRGVDIAVSALAIVALLPVLVFTALAIKADSRGPVLFRQTRIGKDGVPFKVLKFRSMHVDAEERRAALLSQSDRDGVCFKARQDPRVTRVGRVLRRLSVDELPQLLNVLMGQMAIVGPRPALPQEVAAYPTRALDRLKVRPGITGVWQVSGRAEIGFDKMIDMDLAYVASRSVLLDLMLIAMTFRAVLSGRGAY